MVAISSNENFPGGVMFLSTLNDIRVINGQTGLIPNTINTIQSENWSQPIKNTLDSSVSDGVNIYASFYNYTYHLIVGSRCLTFNTKTRGWATQRLITDTIVSMRTLFQFGGYLYCGLNTGEIERMYSSISYDGFDVTATARTGSLPTFGEGSYSVSNDVKYFETLKIYFYPSLNYKLNYKITLDDTDTIEGEIDLTGGAFDPQYFDPMYFDVGANEDYRIIRINRFARWINIEFTQSEGIVSVRGYEVDYSQ
jgi:hypothetical protein